MTAPLPRCGCFFAEIGNERRVVEGRDDVSGVFIAEVSNERRGVMTLLAA